MQNGPLGHEEVFAANGRSADSRTQPRSVFRARSFLCVHQSKLPNHSFLDVVRCGIHLHGSHVHSAYDDSQMDTGSVTTETQRYRTILLCFCISVVVTAAFAIEKEPLQEYR